MQNRRVAVRAIILDGDKLLSARLKKYPDKAVDEGLDFWCVPGGGVEIGEPLISALERELIEETGIKPVIGNLLYIQQFEFKDWEHLEFFFHVTNGEEYREINLAETTHGAIEVAEICFVDPSTKKILPVFLGTQNLVADAESGVTKVFNNFRGL